MAKTRKPIGWPRYMIAMPLADGKVGYFWRARPVDRKARCAIAAEALGSDYGVAKTRADVLNGALDDWRAGRRCEIAPRDEGSVRWMFRIIRTKTQMWENLDRRRQRVIRSATGTNPARRVSTSPKSESQRLLRQVDAWR